MNNIFIGDRIFVKSLNKWGTVDATHSKYIMLIGIKKKGRTQVYYKDIVVSSAEMRIEMYPIFDELLNI